MLWQILNKDKEDIIKNLLKNRNLITKKDIDDFLNPRKLEEIKIQELGVKKEDLEKIIRRLEKAKIKKEKIVIFGDYDCDGVCATAILWEALYKLGFDAMPYIPDRFEEGYGIKANSFENSKFQNLNPKLIITVDNGIVAYDAVTEAKKRRIDIIVVDHHTKETKRLATDYILHSTLVCGSSLAWFLVRELGINTSLDLVTLGTIADQMPLLGINRSLVKYGLLELSKTKRVGLMALFKDLKLDNVDVYGVGYIIAPRINAMGRLANATNALRFLCTRDPKKAGDLNKLLNETNIERQKIVDEVMERTMKEVRNEERVIVISGKYHEGVIGLASGKITEKFNKPSIVLSENGNISKASARSISGFNIIEAIKETGLILEGGGHPMAAGFSIETIKIKEFRLKINELNKEKLTDEILERKLKIDMQTSFENITKELVEELKKFEPVGPGNFSPVFTTSGVEVAEVKPVGSEGKHLKLKLSQNGIVFNAIWFNANHSSSPVLNSSVNIAYAIEENVWNNKTSIQLKIRDIKNDKDIHLLD